MASSSEERQQLAEAIEGLYHVFSRYPLARHVEGCHCCVSESDDERLHSKPLRQLTAEELYRYAFKAMTTWGTADDFKHFLPRLLELVTAEQSITDEMDAEVFFGKLTYAKWQQWPMQEQKVVQDYLHALWAYLLSLSPEAVVLDDFLCAYGRVVDDLTPYLEQWANTKTAFSLKHYFEFLELNESYLPKKKLSNGSWLARSDQMQQVVDWATHPVTEELMSQMLYL